jgi:hypothetical protein
LYLRWQSKVHPKRWPPDVGNALGQRHTTISLRKGANGN